MKVAVFHHFLDNIGGAEMVSLTFAREFDADIYTTNIDEGKIKKMGFADVLPRIHSIGKTPRKAPFRHQLVLWKFRKLNLKNKYDFFIISGDWAISGAVKNHPNLWYIHGPLNELWEFKDYVSQNMLSWWQRPIFEMWVCMNRFLTGKYAKFVDIWVCNSENTRSRIKKFYNAEAKVIYPPIETKKHFYAPHKNYWLSVNRISRPKRIEMQLEAFRGLRDEKLVIVGSYEKGASQFEGYRKEIEKMKPANVEILHFVADEDMKKLYAECKGFITTSKNEDFGMNAIEAMASGKPVIAPNEGGYKESVIHGETGILIDSITLQKLAGAVGELRKRIDMNPERFTTQCQERAKMFDTKEFVKKIREAVNLPQN